MKQKNATLSLFRSLVLVSALLLSFGAMAQTYCTPSYASFASNGAMGNFSLTGYAGSSINDNITITTGYADETSTVPICDMQQGGTYSCTVSYQTGADHTDNQIWIDFNDDGTFDPATESVTPVFPTTYAAVTSYLTSASNSIVIPIGATPGHHRMRVRNVWYYIAFSPVLPSTAFDPCNDYDADDEYYSGVTADYEINIVALASCSGKPTAGHLTGPTFICTNKTFTMVDTALLKYGGMTMQWQQSTPGSGVWTDISGATQQSYTTSITSSTDFRMWAICNSCGSGASCTDTSYVLSVVADSFFHCYCALSTTATPLGGGTPPIIDSVSISHTTLKSATHLSLLAPDYYGRYPDTLNTTGTIKQGGVYKLYVGYKGAPSYGMAWIDYNRNGTFESSEYIEVNSVMATSGIVSFTVPTNAALGKTGLRIRNSTVFSPYSGDACVNFGSTSGAGETQDYIINIAPAPSHDLGVSSFIQPNDGYVACTGALDSVFVNVHNFGSNSESDFFVHAAYSGPSAGSIYTKYIGSVDPGADVTIFVGTINPGDVGKYTIVSYTVAASDTITVNDTSSITMTLKASPAVPMVTSDTVCNGASIATVSVQKVSNVRNLWYLSATDNAPFNTTDSTISISYPTSDTTFFITALGSNGCETEKIPVNIAIGTPPSVNLGPDQTMCESPTFILDAGNPGAKYLWSNGDTTKTIHVTASGTYSVSVFKYCSASDTINLTINPLPSASGIDYTRSGTSYLFSVAGGKNYNSLLWLFGDGDTSTQATPLHTYGSTVVYKVKVVLYNNCGTDTVTWNVPTGIGSLNQQNGIVKIYPNPANDVVTVSAENNGVELKEIQVINTVGAEVYKTTQKAAKININVAGLPAGHYILKINTSKGYINRIFEVVH